MDQCELDIYDLPKNKTNIELVNLKTLSLSKSQKSQFLEDLNIKFSIPNLTNLSIQHDEQFDSRLIERNLVSLFDIYDDDEKDILSELIYGLIYEDKYSIEYYFNKFVGLKDLFLYFYKVEGNHGEYTKKTVELQKNKK